MSNFNVNTFVENQPDNSVDFEADTCLECHACGAEYHEDVIEETPTCSDCGQELNIQGDYYENKAVSFIYC